MASFRLLYRYCTRTALIKKRLNVPNVDQCDDLIKEGEPQLRHTMEAEDEVDGRLAEL